MRWFYIMACLLTVGLSGCGDTAGDPDCQDSDCVNPPASACLDAGTLREYDPLGACDQSGECVYEFTDRFCQNGCIEDHCRPDDPCQGVVCDQPPDNRCEDSQTLWVYDAQGKCSQGNCIYDYSERTCPGLCEQGQCAGVDPCDGVLCLDPPPARCTDPVTVEEFESPGTCDPDNGRCDYESAERNCPDGCALGVCLELTDEYALAIPEGTRVCNRKRSTWDVFDDYHTRMRITFREGAVGLPAGEDEFERDWIESIEFGPDRQVLTALGDGSFTRTASAERMDYRFVQTFTDGETQYTLTYQVVFDPTDPEDRVQVFDELYLTPPDGFGAPSLNLTVDAGEFDRWFFVTCTFDLYLPVLHRVETEDGAVLELHERTYPSAACMRECPTGLLRASYVLGQETREIEDPFRLSFVDSQHNWHDRFLVVFDQPVGDIHALHYYPAENQAPEMKVDHLDSGLNPTGHSLVTSHHTVELLGPFDPSVVQADTCGEYCRDVGLSEDCETSCILEGQTISGRCLPTGTWPPDDDWIPIDSCDESFDTCIAADRPFVQCCCSRIW